VELSGESRVWRGFGVAANYTLIDAEDTNEPSNPIGESFESKAILSVRYRDPGQRFSLGYDVRITGETTTLDLGLNPLGDEIPGFTVHALRAGLNLGAFGAIGQPRLSLVVENLTDELYAEVGNASFFRPSPGRNVTLRWDFGF
jgi:outer membrane receptor protein involved in Fe transport